jgi:hypothetical protein
MTLFTSRFKNICDLRGFWCKMTHHYADNVFGFMIGVFQTGITVGVGAF